MITEQGWSQHEANIASVNFTTEMILLVITIAMFFAVWYLVRNIYVTKKKVALPEDQYQGWEKLSARTLYDNKIYNVLFVKTVEGLGRAGKMFDKDVLDPAVDFIGDGAEDSGKAMKKIQNGNVENYVLVMALAIGILLIVNFILQ